MIFVTWVSSKWLKMLNFIYLFFLKNIYNKMHLVMCEWHMAKSHVAKLPHV
jgi:hypothetical protein